MFLHHAAAHSSSLFTVNSCCDSLRKVWCDNVGGRGRGWAAHSSVFAQSMSPLALFSAAGAVDMNLEQDTESSGSHDECVDRQGDVHRWNTTAQQIGMFNFIHIRPLQLLSCL